MERRGFIDKFAKAALGAVIAPGVIFGEREQRKTFKPHLPIIIKILDETVIKNDRIQQSVLKSMLRSGFERIYPIISRNDFLKTLFPGLTSEGIVGIRIHEPNVSSAATVALVKCLLQVLREFPQQPVALKPGNIMVWSDNDSLIESIYSSNQEPRLFITKDEVDFQHDKEAIQPLSVDNIILTPSPFLSQICQFQMGIASLKSENREFNLPCRDCYLSCFHWDEYPDWRTQLSEDTLERIHQKCMYPLGMRFRMFILENLFSEGTIYIGCDSILLDYFISGKLKDNLDEKIELINIINPSALILPNVKIRRKGDDNILEWEIGEYNGMYQIYRSSNKNFAPQKKLLIGITDKNTYTDISGAVSENHYIVTCRRDEGI